MNVNRKEKTTAVQSLISVIPLSYNLLNYNGSASNRNFLKNIQLSGNHNDPGASHVHRRTGSRPRPWRYHDVYDRHQPSLIFLLNSKKKRTLLVPASRLIVRGSEYIRVVVYISVGDSLLERGTYKTAELCAIM